MIWRTARIYSRLTISFIRITNGHKSQEPKMVAYKKSKWRFCKYARLFLFVASAGLFALIVALNYNQEILGGLRIIVLFGAIAIFSVAVIVFGFCLLKGRIVTSYWNTSAQTRRTLWASLSKNANPGRSEISVSISFEAHSVLRRHLGTVSFTMPRWIMNWGCQFTTLKMIHPEGERNKYESFILTVLSPVLFLSFCA